MINEEVIKEGCRAYVLASQPDRTADQVEAHTRGLMEGYSVEGLAWQYLTGPLLAALAAAVDADRCQPVSTTIN